MESSTTAKILEVQHLAISSLGNPLLHDISFSIHENEFCALIGRSGSGKSMTAYSLFHSFPSPSISIVSGEIFFKGMLLDSSYAKRIRGKEIAYIPQSPLSALNPSMTIGRQLGEGYVKKDSSSKERAIFLLKRLGFYDPENVLTLRPYQLSGGMRQRILIAIALMNDPALLVADEPTTALDVTLQAEILMLLDDLKKEFGLSIIFISHDLGIVKRYADTIVLLKEGRVIEEGAPDELFSKPKTDYAKELIASY